MRNGDRSSMRETTRSSSTCEYPAMFRGTTRAAAPATPLFANLAVGGVPPARHETGIGMRVPRRPARRRAGGVPVSMLRTHLALKGA